MFEYRLVDTMWQWQFCDNKLDFSPFLNIANHIKLDLSATLLLSYLMRFDPLRKLTEKEVKEHVHDIIGHGGELIISRHARERMMERGYGVRDIHHIIMDGTLVNAVTNQEAGNIKYTFNGPDLEGDYGSVVLALVTMQIPEDPDHPFHLIPITDSRRSRSGIPRDSDHGFQSIPINGTRQ